MKRLLWLLPLFIGCQRDPMAPDYWKTVMVCHLTIGDAAPSCDEERCEFVYAEGSWHCPSGVYHPAQPVHFQAGT